MISGSDRRSMEVGLSAVNPLLVATRLGETQQHRLVDRVGCICYKHTLSITTCRHEWSSFSLSGFQLRHIIWSRSPSTHPEGDRAFSARVVVAHSEYKNDDGQANSFPGILQL